MSRVLAHGLEVANRHESSRALERIAGLVPLRIVFAVYHVQEITLSKTEVARIWSGIVVQCLDDLQGCTKHGRLALSVPEKGWREI